MPKFVSVWKRIKRLSLSDVLELLWWVFVTSVMTVFFVIFIREVV